MIVSPVTVLETLKQKQEQCLHQQQILQQQKLVLEVQNEKQQEIQQQQLAQERKWKIQIEELTNTISQQTEAWAVQQLKYQTESKKIADEEQQLMKQLAMVEEEMKKYNQEQQMHQDKESPLKLALQQSEFKHRFALVIGNKKYRETPLKNSVNDAQDIAEVLKILGFQVELLKDKNLQQMESAVHKFVTQLAGLGENVMAFVFYASMCQYVRAVFHSMCECSSDCLINLSKRGTHLWLMLPTLLHQLRNFSRAVICA